MTRRLPQSTMMIILWSAIVFQFVFSLEEQKIRENALCDKFRDTFVCKIEERHAGFSSKFLPVRQ